MWDGLRKQRSMNNTVCTADHIPSQEHRYTVVVEWKLTGNAKREGTTFDTTGLRLAANRIMCESCREVKEL
jgi:hypothetical protein